jgi:DNA-binding NtrC family response regulator
MKKKPLAYYINLVTVANDKHDWSKAKRYGEIALKKLTKLSYSPLEEYSLYDRLGYAYNGLAEYSRSLDLYYKANLIASMNHLSPAYMAYVAYRIGVNFLNTRNINQALTQFQKVEKYYQEHDDKVFPMSKQHYLHTLICLGHCYLRKKEFVKVQNIIENKFTSNELILISKFIGATYYHLKGEYLRILEKYDVSRQSFQECIKISKDLNYPTIGIDSKINLAIIDLLERRLDAAIQGLNLAFGEARRLKRNDFICGIILLLSKCYFLKGMPDKAESTEKRIKPFLKTADIVWLYEITREFEQLYRQLQSIYQTETKSIYGVTIPLILTQTLNQYYETLPYKNIIIGQSVPMQEVYQLIEKIASTDLPVLIQGETGTGKELVAWAIHHNSLRKGKEWLALNCGAVPEPLLENTLFGHTKGAFTDAKEERKGYIESASEGTLFLDEISEMSPAMQQKLLRVIEEKQLWRLGSQKPTSINTRFVFASNQNIEELVKTKKFRLDLFYRINTITITLPPLCDRKEDIPLLVQHFIEKYAVSPKSEKGIEPNALAILQAYPWPGNIRELENEIKRICALYPDIKQITPPILSDNIRNYIPVSLSQSKDGLTLKESREIFERSLIIEVLKKYKGNINQTAQQLGFSWFGLQRKMKQLKIQHYQSVTKK